MAKVVTFKAKEVLGQDYSVMDSMTNIKKIDKGMTNIYNAIDKVDKEKKDKATFVDYNEVISEEVLKGVASLINLNKEDSVKLENMSYSDIFSFYSDAVDKFVGMEVPSVRKMAERLKNTEGQVENTDPKQSSEE